MKNKIALICDGGGMKCVYSAGVLAALAKELNFTDPDIVVGSSGSISFTYYISQQYDSIENIWTNLLASKKFISFKRLFPIMDINYMVDIVFKKQDPLQTDKIINSKIKAFFNVTNYDTGESEYISNNGESDMFEIMRASTAVPLIFNKIIEINGKKYIDGQITSSLGKNIKKAVEEGADKIIIIHYENEDDLSLLAKVFWKICSIFMNKPIRRAISEYIAGKHNFPFPKNIPIYIIKPKVSLHIGMLDNNRKHLKESFDLGYNDVIKDKILKEFIK